MPPPIAIIGAGASGLLLARLLEIHNFDYILYDQGDGTLDPSQHGTLDMHPDRSQAALKEAQLFDEFSRVASFEPQVNAAYDHRGEIITRVDLDLPQIDWCDLRNLLLDSIPAGRIQWNSKIEKVSKAADDGTVTIFFSNGHTETGFKLLIGADGTWSQVRPLLTSIQPTYFGVTYIRTSTSASHPFWSTVQGQAAPTNHFVAGQEKQIISQKNVAGSYTTYIGLKIPEHWPVYDEFKASSADSSAFRDRLINTELAAHKPRALNFVRYSDGPFHAWKLYTMPPDSLCWSSVPGLALVGDALHPTLPWPGEAMSTVLHDSLQLGQQLVKFGMARLDEAVEEYERLAFPRRREYITRCREFGELIYSRDAVQRMEVLLGVLPG